MRARIALFAAALWWGSLTAVGFVVVPLLFARLPSRALAGNLGAQLFTAQTWISVACALVLLLVYKSNRPAASAGQARTAIMFIVLGMLLALLIEFAVAPRIVTRVHLRLWHNVGTGLYVLQWLCAGAVLWRLGSDKRGAA